MTNKKRRDTSRVAVEQPGSLFINAKRARQMEQSKRTQLLVDAYWGAHPNFVCPVTHCRIMLSECWRRQCLIKPQKQAYGSKKADNPFDARCRSGKCTEGLETQRKLGLTKFGSGKDASVPKSQPAKAIGQLPDPAKARQCDLPKVGKRLASPPRNGSNLHQFQLHPNPDGSNGT